MPASSSTIRMWSAVDVLMGLDSPGFAPAAGVARQAVCI
jgi:hypothetical protein